MELERLVGVTRWQRKPIPAGHYTCAAIGGKSLANWPQSSRLQEFRASCFHIFLSLDNGFAHVFLPHRRSSGFSAAVRTCTFFFFFSNSSAYPYIEVPSSWPLRCDRSGHGPGPQYVDMRQVHILPYCGLLHLSPCFFVVPSGCLKRF